MSSLTRRPSSDPPSSTNASCSNGITRRSCPGRAHGYRPGKPSAACARSGPSARRRAISAAHRTNFSIPRGRPTATGPRPAQGASRLSCGPPAGPPRPRWRAPCHTGERPPRRRVPGRRRFQPAAKSAMAFPMIASPSRVGQLGLSMHRLVVVVCRSAQTVLRDDGRQLVERFGNQQVDASSARGRNALVQCLADEVVGEAIPGQRPRDGSDQPGARRFVDQARRLLGREFANSPEEVDVELRAERRGQLKGLDGGRLRAVQFVARSPRGHPRERRR